MPTGRCRKSVIEEIRSGLEVQLRVDESLRILSTYRSGVDAFATIQQRPIKHPIITVTILAQHFGE